LVRKRFFGGSALAQRRLKNWIHATILVAAMAGVLLLSADLIAGAGGVLIVVVFVAAGVLFAPRLAPSFILGMARAVPMGSHAWPEIHSAVKGLSDRAALPRTPRVYYVPESSINAFTLGSRQDAAIVISHGALRALSLRELNGVLAHEIAHVAADDIMLLTLSEVMGRLARTMAIFGLIAAGLLVVGGEAAVSLSTVLIFAGVPMGVSLLQLALSRNREFDADRVAAELTDDPVALASALRKIEQEQTAATWRRLLRPCAPKDQPALLRTHPRTEDRIARLLQGH
jgi:heat shock protein HtpX